MRDLSQNKYVKSYNSANHKYDTFCAALTKKTVDDNEFRSLIRDLLAQFGFCIHFNGYKYLARLVELYLMENDYCEPNAIEKLANYYGEHTQNIVVGLTEVISCNIEFARLAAHVLNVPEKSIENNISDTVEAVAAIFNIYYSHSFDCKTHSSLEQSSINFLQVMDYVQRTNKKN